jgi:hypothetical protein
MAHSREQRLALPLQLAQQVPFEWDREIGHVAHQALKLSLMLKASNPPFKL